MRVSDNVIVDTANGELLQPNVLYGVIGSNQFNFIELLPPNANLPENEFSDLSLIHI